MTTYMVQANMPGYLSEDDEPFTTNDITDARNYLAALVERDWDSEYDGAEDDDERLAIDGRYLDAHSEINLISVPGYVHVPGPTDTHLGINYYITIVVEDDDNG